MSTPSEVDGFPKSKIDLCRKYRSMAEHSNTTEPEKVAARVRLEKLEAKYPGIGATVTRLEQAERLAYEQRQQQGVPTPQWAHEKRTPTTDELIDFYQKIAPLYRQMLEPQEADGLGQRFFRNVMGWALDQLDYAASEAKQGELMTLKERIEEDADIEVEDAEDEDTGEPLITLSITMSTETWARICNQKNGPKSFVSVLAAVANEDVVEN